MGARALNTPSVHALHLRGLLPAVEQAALLWLGANPEFEPEFAADDTGERPKIFVGHFAGIGIRVDRIKPPGPGDQFLGAGVISQAELGRSSPSGPRCWASRCWASRCVEVWH